MSIITIDIESMTVNGIPYVDKDDRGYVISFIEEQMEKRKEFDIDREIKDASIAAVSG